ncbi:unnamed protein product [Coffea canephora]|uniref:Prefoldin subunit 2 n=2 Tax=Coffea TaxID=13442 RepID=A0A068TSY2_COFCA|nr:unnamed protein product [Coffea canephora]
MRLNTKEGAKLTETKYRRSPGNYVLLILKLRALSSLYSCAPSPGHPSRHHHHPLPSNCRNKNLPLHPVINSPASNSHISSTKIMAGRAEAEPVNEQAVANVYGSMRAEMNQIYSKITELEMEVSEHSLVINAIQPLDPSRRCYRMIGGVLVERTVKEVLPAVQRNKEGLLEVIARLNEALEKKKKEIADFEAKYKIRIRKADEMKDEGGKKEGSAQGVLVGPAGGDE